MASAWSLAIHGGAGVTRNTTTDPEAAQEGLRRALIAGQEVLRGRGTALDAVVAAVSSLEDNPLFNAGRGSVLTRDGTVEMDAMLMDGASGASGAITGCRSTRNPIQLAHAVMQRTPHRMLAGRVVDEYAAGWGLEQVSPDFLITHERAAQQRQAMAQGVVTLDHVGADALQDPTASGTVGTVGAVALDVHGNLAAATSTGGLTNKWAGRVGDSPLIGCGTWADNSTCAVSATGTGEAIMSVALAHRIAIQMELHPTKSLKDASDEALASLSSKTGGSAGLIAIDRHGNVVTPFITEGMYRGGVTQAVDSMWTAIY